MHGFTGITVTAEKNDLSKSQYHSDTDEDFPSGNYQKHGRYLSYSDNSASVPYYFNLLDLGVQGDSGFSVGYGSLKELSHYDLLSKFSILDSNIRSSPPLEISIFMNYRKLNDQVAVNDVIRFLQWIVENTSSADTLYSIIISVLSGVNPEIIDKDEFKKEFISTRNKKVKLTKLYNYLMTGKFGNENKSSKPVETEIKGATAAPHMKLN